MPTPIQTQSRPSAVSRHPDVDTIVVPPGRDLVRDYEDGKLILMDGFASSLAITPAEWDLVTKAGCLSTGPHDKWIKKAKLRELLAPIGPDYASRHVLAALGLDQAAALIFQDLIRRVNVELEQRVRAMFPGYVFTNVNAMWRFSVTGSEDMHFDSYGLAGDENENHMVRLFINMDCVPRLWAISHSMPTAVSVYADRIKETGIDLNLHPNLLNAELNLKLPWAEFPRTFLAFAPGSAWLANSQLASHEIIFGRRMIGFTCDVDPASMQDPSKAFQPRGRAAVAAIR